MWRSVFLFVLALLFTLFIQWGTDRLRSTMDWDLVASNGLLQFYDYEPFREEEAVPTVHSAVKSTPSVTRVHDVSKADDVPSSAAVYLEHDTVKSILPSTDLSPKPKDAVILERIMRWRQVPTEEKIHPSSPGKKHYRLVFAVTADVSQSTTQVPSDVANTLISLALLQRNFNFLPVLFTISKPLIAFAESLGIPYYFGYQSLHNQFHLPRVDAIFADLYRDVSSDYYGIINGDILISDSVFTALDILDTMVKNHTISEIRGIAGVVRDITPIDLIGRALHSPGLSLSMYRDLLDETEKKHFVYRHYCSADYFVFSRSTPLSAFGPYVLGRYNIDNYLLSRMKECNGSLVDTTFAFSGFHQGGMTNINKARNSLVLDGDLRYNIELMKANKVKKGCLFRSASRYLFARNGEFFSNPYSASSDVALETFKELKKVY